MQPERIAWRPQVEEAILTRQQINGVIIRAGLIYGRAMSFLSPMFQSAYDGDILWPGRTGTRYTLVHQDDFADLVVRLAEQVSI